MLDQISITTDPTLMLILTLIIILIVTCFMDTIATLTMLMPVLFPAIESVGADPVLFCVLVVVCVGIGLVTPPVGVCLYIACDLMKIGIIPASKALIPFLIVSLLCLGLMIVFPQVVLWPASWI